MQLASVVACACAHSLGRACQLTALLQGATSPAVDRCRFVPFGTTLGYELAADVVAASALWC